MKNESLLTIVAVCGIITLGIVLLPIAALSKNNFKKPRRRWLP